MNEHEGRRGKTGATGPRGPRDSRALILTLCVLTGVVLLVAIVLSTVVLIRQPQIDRNTKTVTRVARRLDLRERTDRKALREASYRICEREERVRAELHFRAGLTPPQVLRQIVGSLGLPPSLAGATTLASIERRLPLFDCKPNLRGQQARQMGQREARRYVRRYAEDKLPAAPTPEPVE